MTASGRARAAPATAPATPSPEKATGISSEPERLERELARVGEVARQLGPVRDAERVEPRAHAGKQPRDLAPARRRIGDQQHVAHGGHGTGRGAQKSVGDAGSSGPGSTGSMQSGASWPASFTAVLTGIRVVSGNGTSRPASAAGVAP